MKEEKEMRCPRCNSDRTLVVNSHTLRRRPSRRRSRKCLACDERFMTSEDYSDTTLKEVEEFKKNSATYRLTVGFEGMEEVLERHLQMRSNDED